MNRNCKNVPCARYGLFISGLQGHIRSSKFSHLWMAMPARCSQRLDRFLHALFVSVLVLQITLQCLKDYIGTVPDSHVMQGNAKWCKLVQSGAKYTFQLGTLSCVEPMPHSGHSCMTVGTVATTATAWHRWHWAQPLQQHHGKQQDQNSKESVCHWPPVTLQRSQPVAAASFVCLVLKYSNYLSLKKIQ